jgi:Undecaprenyl-phosphate glucose phosphotransferase
MGQEFPVAGGSPLLGSQTPGLDLLDDAAATSRFGRWIRYKTVGYLTGALDYLMIVMASIVAGAAYHLIFLGGYVPDLMSYVAAGNIVAALFVLGAASRGNYSPSAIVSVRRQVRSVILFWSLAFLSLALFLFLAKSGSDFSRGSIVIFGVLGFVSLLGSHLRISASLKDALAQGTLAGDRAITIGDRDAMMALSQASILSKAGAREVKRYALPSVASADDAEALNIVDEAVQFTRSNNVDCVLLALQWNDEVRRDAICERLQVLPIPVLLLPDRHVESIYSRARQLARGFTVELQRPPLSSGELAMKRALDLIMACSLLVALVPLICIVALLIKLESPGSVIFSQRRKGFNGREFTIFKFRTMNVVEDGHVIIQARRNDPRITLVGRFLRATSIDELPQLLNVVHGQMSLVGPRPHAVAHDDGYAKAIAKYAFRQHVKPGLSGWAQVNGFRGETARLEQMAQRVECDLWYIKNWSFWLDLKILLLTGFELLRRRNAY